MQANVDPSKPVEEWPLEQLAGKLAQYCPLMQDIQGSTLQQQAKGGSGFENLRAFLRNRGEQAYFQRVCLLCMLRLALGGASLMVV